MTAFEVDLDELAAVVAAMAACERDLAHQVAELDAAHHQLHSGWSGRSSDAHDHAHAGWRGGFEEMATALAGLRSLGEVARNNYAAAVEANLELWHQVT